MKVSIPFFKGEIPILGNTKLPEGNASIALNSRVVTGDLSSYYDFGNYYQLAKSAPIVAEYLIPTSTGTFWMQYSSSENTYGNKIDISPGTIPGDTTYRMFVSGTLTGLRQTNLYYATDPSQQGSNTLYAYPYVTFPVGIANPASAPTATTNNVSPTPSTYEYLQPVSINNVTIATAGANYKVNDTLTVSGGTTGTGLAGATLSVTSVDSSGAITGISVLTGGFYTTAPTSPASVTGGSGSGATFTLTTQTITYAGLSPQNYNNGAGSYITWDLGSTDAHVATGQGDLSVAYTKTALSLITASKFTYQVDAQTQNNGGAEYPDLVFYLTGTPTDTTDQGSFRQLGGPAVVLSLADSKFILYSSVSGSNGGSTTGTVVASNTVSVSGDTYYRVNVIATQNTSGSTPGFSVTVTLALQSTPSTIISTLSGFVPYSGEQMGIGTNHRYNHNDGNDAAFQNLLITITQPVSSVTNESTSYVYTYVSQYGSGANEILQESGPSDPSSTLTIYINNGTNPATLSPVTVTIPAAPTGQDITNYNLYRLVTQTDGSEVYQLVAEIAASTTGTTTYTDTTLDKNLGNAITTTDYAPAPSNLQGIVALPNGVMAGFFDNTLALSAVNFPFAWPVNNQYSTDTNIVAIAPIDTTVFILTTAHPYTAFGSDPANYSMSKETSVQGCVSAKSVATHRRAGVIYAAGNGLAYYRGQGNLDLLRDQNGNPYFSYEQWQALNPSSILGVVHDDYYWFWYDATGTGGSKGGYVLDIPEFFGFGGAKVGEGFGLIELDFHVTSAYVDPQEDKLFVTIDKSTYAVNGNVVTAAQNILSQWEGGTTYRTQSWARDEILLPRDATFNLAQVRAEDYSALTLTVTNETGTIYNAAVTSEQPFIVAPQPGKRLNIKITGTSVVNEVMLYESNREISPT